MSLDQGSPDTLSPLSDGIIPVSSPAIDKPVRVGAPLYADVWPNRKVARVASLSALGYTPTSIAAMLDDGTTRNQIASMTKAWGITAKSDTETRNTWADLRVPLCGRHRTALAIEAERRGIELPELMTKLAEAIVRDGLFDAVLDG